MPNYSADDIIGASLYAKKQVPIKNGPFPESAIIRYAYPGALIGVVETYNKVNPATGVTVLHWVFRNSQGAPFYVAHDGSALEVSGVYTPPVEQLTPFEQVANAVKLGVGGFLLIQAGRLFFKR